MENLAYYLVLAIGCIPVAWFIIVVLNSTAHFTTVDVLSGEVLKSEESLILFLESNKDEFYSKRSWLSICKLKNKIEDFKEHELKNAKDLDYIESIASIKLKLIEDYKMKVFGLLKAKIKYNPELQKHVGGMIKSTLRVSIMSFSNLRFVFKYKTSHEISEFCIKKTVTILKKLNFKDEASELALWGPV